MESVIHGNFYRVPGGEVDAGAMLIERMQFSSEQFREILRQRMHPEPQTRKLIGLITETMRKVRDAGVVVYDLHVGNVMINATPQEDGYMPTAFRIVDVGEARFVQDSDEVIRWYKKVTFQLLAYYVEDALTPVDTTVVPLTEP